MYIRKILSLVLCVFLNSTVVFTAAQAQTIAKPLPAAVNPIALRPYEEGEWKKLLSQRGNKPLVVHFWGVTCGPCLTEMSQWGKFVNQGEGQVIFVQVDEVSMDITRNLAQKMHIDKAPNYVVRSKFDEFLRYEIDTKWTGEIPYTVTIDKNGLQKAYSGNTKFKELQAWFRKNS